MNEQILRRKILQIAYENKNSNLSQSVELENYPEFKKLDFKFMHGLTSYLRGLGLIDFVADSSVSWIRITTMGIQTYENKDLLNKFLPVILPETEETQKLTSFVESFLKSDIQYNGILNDFEKSYNFLYGENIDFDNAAKEIALALEGLANVILKTKKKTLGELKNKLLQHFSLLPNLASVIQGVYNFRGDMEGVTHSSGIDDEVTFEEAEFIFNVCCSIIIMIARRSGYEPQ